jgi:hypothetical protein
MSVYAMRSILRVATFFVFLIAGGLFDLLGAYLRLWKPISDIEGLILTFVFTWCLSPWLDSRFNSRSNS